MVDNFNVTDYGEGIGALTRRADAVLMHVNNLKRRSFLDYQWRTFFPDDSYREVLNYAVKSIDVLAESCEGAFRSAALKETNDVPEIKYLAKKQNMPFNNERAMIEISEDQLELFRMVNSEDMMGEVVSLMDKKINAAYTVAGEIHNNIFFQGNSKVDGILTNPFIVDITSQVTPTPDFVQWFGQAAMVAGTLSEDQIATPNVYISPSMASKINSYSTGTDRSLLDKIEGIRISRQGKSFRLSVSVLSYLNASPNDVLFLSDQGSNFFYAYKPLRIRPFRPFGLQSFSALCDFGYTEPMTFLKYSICKATYKAS